MQRNTKRTRLKQILKKISRAREEKKKPLEKNVVPMKKKEKNKGRIHEKNSLSVQCMNERVVCLPVPLLHRRICKDMQRKMLQ